MSLNHGKTTRHILPRWRASNTASGNVEFVSLKPPRRLPTASDAQTLGYVTQFEHAPSIGTAAELVSSALLDGKPEVAAPAAAFLLQHQDVVPSTLIQLAKSVAGNPGEGFISASIRVEHIAKTRQMLRFNPNNPVLWSDMARHFASLGDKRRAYRCMKTALHLAPNHRWIVRTTARFLVHQMDPVAAQKLLIAHPRTRTDPWLIAAELACAQVAERPPKFWKQATEMLRQGSLPPRHLSELATAVAMMELEEGERKRARKYIQKGLLDPTENTLAQVYWAKENRRLNDGFQLDQLVRSTNDAYEAD